MFSIPVYDRTGNGYIFDSDYITVNAAKDEVDKFFNKDVDIVRKIDFDPGALDRVWINNCCAVGLGANFVEPLEATSIGHLYNKCFY
jgi:tryptophan halogenase